MIVAWFMLALATLEEVTDYSQEVVETSSLSAVIVLGGIAPLVISHLGGLGILGTVTVLGRSSWRSRLMYPIVAVAVASLIGMAVILMINDGHLITPPPKYIP